MLILGSGPNRIGQGIEFDYCCVQAAFALRAAGYETIMLNCNPETVSTDYDTSDRLYFEPLTFEDVMNVVERERPEGVIVQLGGQTPLKLAARLVGGRRADLRNVTRFHRPGRGPRAVRGPARGPEASTPAERDGSFDRGRARRRHFDRVPGTGQAVVTSSGAARWRSSTRSRRSSASWSLRPKCRRRTPSSSTVSWRVRSRSTAMRSSTATELFVGGVLEHIEEAGIHSGDSACALPPFTLGQDQIDEVIRHTDALARALDVARRASTSSSR